MQKAEKRVRTNKSHHVNNNDGNDVNINGSSGLNSMLLIAAGFVAVIFYTIWSSIRTYSEQMHYDME
jgi:hypothetical protein